MKEGKKGQKELGGDHEKYKKKQTIRMIKRIDYNKENRMEVKEKVIVYKRNCEIGKWNTKGTKK